MLLAVDREWLSPTHEPRVSNHIIAEIPPIKDMTFNTLLGGLNKFASACSRHFTSVVVHMNVCMHTLHCTQSPSSTRYDIDESEGRPTIMWKTNKSQVTPLWMDLAYLTKDKKDYLKAINWLHFHVISYKRIEQLQTKKKQKVRRSRKTWNAEIL